VYLLVGGDSEIGSATARLLDGQGHAVMTTTRRPGELGGRRVLLDFENLADWQVPKGLEAACVFVAIARLAACDADPEGSARINCGQTLALARKLAAAGVYTLFLSSNQVFDGTVAHVSADARLCPISTYGRQKATMETALHHMMAQGQPIGVLRLSKVISPGMALLSGWRQALAAGRPIRAFHDMRLAPTPVAQVAEAITRMLADRVPVIAQLTGPADVSYADIGRLFARRLGVGPGLVEPVSALDHGMPVGATPRHTTLDSHYLRQRHGIVVAQSEDVALAAVFGSPQEAA
jgi:dTDP-4-dehydrorhamnose reductase